MGTDLFTSSHGPGVIGTFMAIFVLLGFGTLYVLVFDKSLQGGGQTIESVIAADAKEMLGKENQILSTKKRVEAAKEYRKTAATIEEAQVREKLLTQRRTALQQTIEEEKQSISDLADSWESYKQDYRKSERASAAGEEIAELKTLTGTAYTKVKITDVDAVRMQIRHSGGIKGIPFEELPLDLQDRFQFDSNEREVRVATETADRNRGHIGSSIGDLKIAIADLKHQNTQSATKLRKLEQALSNARSAGPELESQLVAKERELDADLKQRSDRTSNGRQGISRAPQIRQELASIQNLISLASRRIPQLSDQIDQEEIQIRAREGELESLQTKLDALVEKFRESPDAEQP